MSLGWVASLQRLKDSVLEYDIFWSLNIHTRLKTYIPCAKEEHKILDRMSVTIKRRLCDATLQKSKAYPLFQVPGHNVPPAANSLQADVKSHHRHNLASGLRFRVADGSHALFWLRYRQEWSI